MADEDWETIAHEWEKIAKKYERNGNFKRSSPKRGADMLFVFLVLLLMFSALGNFFFIQRYSSAQAETESWFQKYNTLLNQSIANEQAMISELNSMDSRIQALETEKSTYLSEISSLESQMTSSDKKVLSLQTILESYKEKVSELESEISELESELAAQKTKGYYYYYGCDTCYPYYYYPCRYYPCTGVVLSLSYVIDDKGTPDLSDDEVTLTAVLGPAYSGVRVDFYINAVYRGSAYTDGTGVAQRTFPRLTYGCTAHARAGYAISNYVTWC
ncbi:MAG: hypothetical protein ACE5K0_06580 [Candidatus Methanofastidiosia archaeon]